MFKFLNFYSQFFKNLKPNPNGEASVNCPFHDDKHPSMSINLESGLWKCFACDLGGDHFTFYQKIHNISFREAKERIEKEFSIKEEEETIDISILKNLKNNLKKAKTVRELLKKERGLKEETIEKFQLGWDGERLCIPIFNNKGKLVNIRRYAKKKKGIQKMVSWKEGFGIARLFPIQNLVYEEILIVEGELDCLLANQEGFHAITVTSGAGTWKDSWNSLFQDKKVRICYDIDKEGKRGALKVAKALSGFASEIRIIELPITSPPNADFTDYIISNGYSKADFKELIKKAKRFKVSKEVELLKKKDNFVYEVHLSQASNEKYNNKFIKVQAVISGKDLAPYLIPKKVKFSCSFDSKDCGNCGLSESGGEKIIEFRKDDPTLLQMVSVSRDVVKGILRKKAGIKSKCYKCKIDEIESMNIEEIFLIPEIDFTAEDQEYVVRKSYFIGHGIKPNASYKFVGKTLSDPRNQYATHLFSEANPSQDNIANFKMTDELFKQLKIFQGKPLKKMNEIQKDLEINVVRIWGRKDIYWAIDLVYHSVLAFFFQKKLIEKGWLEVLIIGDSRSGKTSVAQSLLRHYQLGEYITGENTSLAGLIGGIQQAQRRFTLTWGKIVLNNKRLVIIDEASGLSPETISQLSGVRSEGIAELVKIHHQKTEARTRLIWLSNPRSGRSLNTYGFGVTAVKELIIKNEDIARFDFAVSSASNEVDIKEINKLHIEEFEHKYTSGLCRKLILWSWSRKPENIKFEKDAVELILERASLFGETYSNRIPLVDGAEHRIALAKLSTALACRLFSTTDGENVIVKPEHIDFISDFLNQIYSKESFAYFQYSEKLQKSKKISEENQIEIFDYIRRHKDAMELISRYDYFRPKFLKEMLGIPSEEASNIVAFLSRNALIKYTTAGYVKEEHFIQFLRKLL